MKKLSVTLLAVMSVGILPACNNGGQSASGSEASAPAGKVYVSQHNFDATLGKLRGAIQSRQLMVMNEIDHSKGAKSVGLELERTHLVLFGSPKVGTLLMQQNPQMGLELPMKALIFEQDGKVFVRVTNIEALADTYNLKTAEGPVPNVALALDMIAKEATK